MRIFDDSNKKQAFLGQGLDRDRDRLFLGYPAPGPGRSYLQDALNYVQNMASLGATSKNRRSSRSAEGTVDRLSGGRAFRTLNIIDE